MDRKDHTTGLSFEGAEIVLVLRSLSLFLQSHWPLKHFLPTNSIAQSPADEKQNAIGRQKMFQPIAYDQ